jgi:hypothetical protein
MNFRLSSFLVVAASLALASCTQSTIPDAAAMERFQQHARCLFQEKLDDLERRRAAGLIDSYTYQQEKAALDNEIAAKASDLAWTRHDFSEMRRKSMGLPTPDRPLDISVPEAGGLPTGGGYRRFNNTDLGLGAGGADSREAMRRAAVGSLPGNNTRN